MRVAGELQELHLLQLNPHQFKALGLRHFVAEGFREGAFGIEESLPAQAPVAAPSNP